jgi:lantibiotic leader peptide-processing serine protease
MTIKHRLIAVTAGLLILSSGEQAAQLRDGSIVADRVVVIFRNMALPDNAGERIEAAGGVVVNRLDDVGVLIASPGSADAATLIRNLRRDAVVLDAGYDAVLDLVAPFNVGTNTPQPELSPSTHIPHPLPTFSPLLPADFFYTSSPQQWSVKRIGAQGGGISGGGSGAWDTTFGAGARIAILDTGVNPEHPDLSPNLVFNAALTFDIPSVFGTPNCEVPDPANPLVDLPEDQFGHGTFTSSLAAAAAGAGTGLLIGVAPEARILNIKVVRARPATPAELATLGVPDTPYNRCLFRNANALVSWVLQGMLVANALGADVISMSLGAGIPRNMPGGDGAAVWSAFNRVANFVTSRGSVLVAAAGNTATDLDRVKAIVAVPVDSPNVIAVTATTNPALLPPTPPARQPCAPGEDCLASYSNYGSSLHGVAAPGGDLPGGTCAATGTPCLPTGFVRGACAAGVDGTTEPSSAGYPASGPPPPGTSWGCFANPTGFQHAWYIQATGTSAATPLVAGVAALIKSANPTLTPAQIRTILQQTAEDIGPVGHDQFFNFGLVNASAAVARASR